MPHMCLYPGREHTQMNAKNKVTLLYVFMENGLAAYYEYCF